MDRVEREVTVEASVEDAWAAVSDPAQLSGWFGADVEMTGGRAKFRFPDGTQRSAVVEERREPTTLSLRWLPFEQLPGGDVEVVPPTLVEITLDEVAGGTRIRVVETLIGSGPMRASVRGLQMLARV